MNFNLFDDFDDRVVYNRTVHQKESDINNIGQTTSNYDGSVSSFPNNTPLGMAYVPFQKWENVYELNDAFPKGTLFPELDFPFMRGADNNE